MIKTIAFDADDTLWENENFYQDAHVEYVQLMNKYGSDQEVLEHLHRIDVGNISRYGYGVKSFVLGMIEAAVEISEGKLSAEDTTAIIGIGDKLLNYPINVLPNVERVLKDFRARFNLIAITKGDLLDQNGKMDRSGLRNYFDEVVVVSEKDEASYEAVLQQRGILPEEFLMVGNSIKSDVQPVINIGGYGVHVPFRLTWHHEEGNIDETQSRLIQIKEIDEILNIDLLANHVEQIYVAVNP
ncbi:MAG: HAD family hydrolase [Marinifilaceae bacterium]